MNVVVFKDPVRKAGKSLGLICSIDSEKFTETRVIYAADKHTTTPACAGPGTRPASGRKSCCSSDTCGLDKDRDESTFIRAVVGLIGLVCLKAALGHCQ